MVTPFAGKVALITGAAGGIGRAVAHAFAEAGASLALVDRAAEGMPLDGPGEVLPITCDIGDAAALDGAVARMLERFGRFDLLVNVAGIMLFKPIEEHDAADWARLLSVNLLAPALFTGHALRHMPAGGAIVNVASVHARRTSEIGRAHV